jgi:hypothetical protein
MANNYFSSDLRFAFKNLLKVELHNRFVSDFQVPVLKKVSRFLFHYRQQYLMKDIQLITFSRIYN